MSPRPLVHIGMPKCASTWLQRHFFMASNGYAQAQSPFGAHLALAEPGSFRLADWSEARALFELEQGELVPVITQETLVGNPLTGGHDGEANLHRLRQLVPDARILLLVREQRAMLRSLYKTLVTFGSPLTITEHLRGGLAGTAPLFAPSYLCYDAAIAAYRAVFGEEAVLVLPVEWFSAAPAEFLRRISEFCGIDAGRYPLRADPERRENVNRSLLDLELKRLFNRYVARTRMSPRGLYTPKTLGGSGNLHLPAPAALHEAMETRFARQVELLTRGLFEDSNAATARLTGLELGAWNYALPE